MEPIIVADVGGTNGRFAVAGFENGEITLRNDRVYSNTGIGNFAELLSLYLDDVGNDAPTRACFATAGPNNGRRGIITNLDWSLDAEELEQQFGLDDVLFVNDFKALARMAVELGAADYQLLNGVADRPAGPASVIGPGTGLGVALVLREHNGVYAVATEGGHMTFAPQTEQHLALRDYLARDHHHVHCELMLSGDGLVRLSQFLAAEGGRRKPGLSAAEITAAALAGDAEAVATVELFLSLLGSVAGDVALTHGAVGGVYLGGGIVRRVLPLVESSGLCERFIDKGIMADYLRHIPIKLITADRVARRGAALLYCEN